MEDRISVYLSGKGVSVPRGCTALEAVRLASPEQALAIEEGLMMLTDSRGLPVDPASATYAGAIFRIVRQKANEVASAPVSDQ